LEVARVARAGYPTRYLHKQFIERYEVVLPAGRHLDTHSPQAVVATCQELLNEFRVGGWGRQEGVCGSALPV
jgi:myosin-5